MSANDGRTRTLSFSLCHSAIINHEDVIDQVDTNTKRKLHSSQTSNSYWLIYEWTEEWERSESMRGNRLICCCPLYPIGWCFQYIIIIICRLSSLVAAVWCKQVIYDPFSCDCCFFCYFFLLFDRRRCRQHWRRWWQCVVVVVFRIKCTNRSTPLLSTWRLLYMTAPGSSWKIFHSLYTRMHTFWLMLMLGYLLLLLFLSLFSIDEISSIRFVSMFGWSSIPRWNGLTIHATKLATSCRLYMRMLETLNLLHSPTHYFKSNV